METNRFETFIDAIIAIIITVLVLKIPQPATPTLAGVLELQNIYIAYLISFLILYNIWYANHNLFQAVDTIDNRAVWIYSQITIIYYFLTSIRHNQRKIPHTIIIIIIISSSSPKIIM